jgi:hypothetical protein
VDDGSGMNPYEVLGVSPAATMAEIQARYRLLLRECHPDLHQGEGAEALAELEVRTRNLNLAIEKLRESLPLQGQPAGRRPHDRTGWERPRTDAPRGDQWAGQNPFWRERDAESRSGAGGDAAGDAGADPRFGHYYDWFGNPVDDGTDDPVPCPFCGKPYERLDDYEHHLEHVHRYRPKPPPPRVHKPPGPVLAKVGKLRYLPSWMVMLLALAIWAMFGFTAFSIAFAFVAVVLWTQTTPRFRR